MLEWPTDSKMAPFWYREKFEVIDVWNPQIYIQSLKLRTALQTILVLTDNPLLYFQWLAYHTLPDPNIASNFRFLQYSRTFVYSLERRVKSLVPMLSGRKNLTILQLSRSSTLRSLLKLVWLSKSYSYFIVPSIDQTNQLSLLTAHLPLAVSIPLFPTSCVFFIEFRLSRDDLCLQSIEFNYKIQISYTKTDNRTLERQSRKYQQSLPLP